MRQSFLLLFCLVVPFTSAGINHFHFNVLNYDKTCNLNNFFYVVFKIRSFQNPFADYESHLVVIRQREKQRQ